MLVYGIQIEPVKGWVEQFEHPEGGAVVFMSARDALMVAQTLYDLLKVPVTVYWAEADRNDFAWKGNVLDLREYVSLEQERPKG
jgi:hypothetical protein